MAEVSTVWKCISNIVFILTTVLLVSTNCNDVEVNLEFPQPHLQTVVEYNLLHSKVRFRRQVSNISDVSDSPELSTSSQVTQLPITTVPPIQTSQASEKALVNEPKGTTTARPKIIEDNHSYYGSITLADKLDKYWIDLPSIKKHSTLSQNHRTAVTIDLKFPFRFYGHNITNITVATGGFLYTSPFLHQWLTATQYIAPLMANFDTRIGNDSGIYYDSLDDKFIVQWKAVYLQDKNITESFEFEVILYRNGTIIFLYKTIPIDISEISDNNHPVKIGLSDAFYIDTFFKEKGIRRRTIYEYNRVQFSFGNIQSGTVIILNPLPTCNTISDCGECMAHTNVVFKCNWCNAVSRCSDGIDWHRQTWLEKGCKDLNNQNSVCPTTVEESTTRSTSITDGRVSSTTESTTRSTSITDGRVSSTTVSTTRSTSITDGRVSSTTAFPVAAVIAVILILVLITVLGVWLYYAYTHPTSPSGLWLLENRPSIVKEKLSKMTFWKKNTSAGTQYAVESTA